jgi:hypothetical protein
MVIKYTHDDSVIPTLHWHDVRFKSLTKTGRLCGYKEIALHVSYRNKYLHDGIFIYKDSCHKFPPIVLHVHWLKKQ